MQGKAADCHMLFRMISEIKVPSDRFSCVVVVLLCVTKVFSETIALGRLPVSPMYNFLQRAQVMQ